MQDAINAALEKKPTLKAFSYKALQACIPVAAIFMYAGFFEATVKEAGCVYASGLFFIFAVRSS
jgi:hypothetical protein